MIIIYDVVLYIDGDVAGERKRFALLKPKTAPTRETKQLFLRLSLRSTINGRVHKRER